MLVVRTHQSHSLFGGGIPGLGSAQDTSQDALVPSRRVLPSSCLLRWRLDTHRKPVEVCDPQTKLHRRWTLSTHPSTIPWVPPALSRTWPQIFSCICAATWEMVGVSSTHTFTSCRCPWSSVKLEPPLAATKLKSQLAQWGGRASPGPLSIAVGWSLTGLPHWARAVGAQCVSPIPSL